MAHFKHVVINIHWVEIKIGISELLQLTKYINKLIWLLTREENGYWSNWLNMRLYIFIKYTNEYRRSSEVKVVLTSVGARGSYRI